MHLLVLNTCFLELSEEDEGGAINVLNNLNIELLTAKDKIEEFGQKNNIEQAITKKQLPLTKQAEKALKTTFLEARESSKVL